MGRELASLGNVDCLNECTERDGGRFLCRAPGAASPTLTPRKSVLKKPRLATPEAVAPTTTTTTPRKRVQFSPSPPSPEVAPETPPSEPAPVARRKLATVDVS